MILSKDTIMRIRQCCVYISDDSQIAAYVSSTWEPVTAKDVARVRARMDASDFPNSMVLIPGVKRSEAEPIGLDKELAHRRDAEQGSRALLKALDRYWRKRGVPGPWMQESAA